MSGFDIEESAGFLIAKAHQRLFACFRDELAPFGITPPQFALLAFLWKQDGLSQVELSDKTAVDRTTISGLVDRLQKSGLVVRRPHPEDRRACLVHLTAPGKALEERLTPVALRVRGRIGADLGPGEYDQLCQLLNKLRGKSDE
jgi:MarR family transcriptional regulator, lower aerobic nicotinate degradation pathway regulator